ncbi:LysR family transcriptional regulator [Rhizobium ruizarguesonis]
MLLAQSDLRSFTVFRAVVDHKSFLGSQIALGLSQSAVSFHIKALEDRLGFKLCQRGRSVFECTDVALEGIECEKKPF